ncbi:protein phosphatase 2C domain-containing protein [Endozoicomonas sp. Mp262]|uniref:protein phosphatase 2C domain-containing protein n=1 Tax=Endozoicomonas sp. Mp262 TaxID=2919499 RepID=UPI0021DB644E
MCEITPFGIYCKPCCCSDLIDVTGIAGSGVLNEDQVLIKDNTYAVFDGASSLVNNSWQGKSGAWWAAKCAAETLSQKTHNNSDLSLSHLFIKANQKIAGQMEQAGVDRENRLGLWSCTGAAIRFYPGLMEYAQIGDSLILCIKKDGSHFLPAPYHNHDHETLSAWQALAKQGCTNIRKALSALIAKTRLQMNRRFGVLNGEQHMTHFLKSGTVLLKNIKAVLIFTDGLHWPSEQLSARADFSTLVNGYLTSGLHGLHQGVRALERQDPLCQRYPRFKQHDDIAAIALNLGTMIDG